MAKDNKKLVQAITSQAENTYDRNGHRTSVHRTGGIKVKSGKDTYSFRAINWNISVPEKSVYKTVDMKKIFNDKVSNIFAYGKYMFPRWKYTTLQVPTQGM